MIYCHKICLPCTDFQANGICPSNCLIEHSLSISLGPRGLRHHQRIQSLQVKRFCANLNSWMRRWCIFKHPINTVVKQSRRQDAALFYSKFNRKFFSLFSVSSNSAHRTLLACFKQFSNFQGHSIIF